MHFVEVAVQNVRGFSPAGRLPLRTGYLVLSPPAEPSPLAGLALALLYPDGRGDELSLVGPAPRAGKAALTLVGQDGLTYRVLRELGGGGTLHRLNPATQTPELLTQDLGELIRILRGQAGLPPRATFEQACCLLSGQLPSRRPRSKPSQVGLAAPAVMGGLQGVRPAADIGAAEAKLHALEQELVRSKEAGALQFEVDGLSSQLFDAEDKLRSTDALKAQLREAEAILAAEPSPESLGLPQDILARVERYPKVVDRRDEALEKLQAEREAAEAALADLEGVEPLRNNQVFWLSLAAGVLFLGLGMVLNGAARYVALLDIPAFGVAAVLALRYVDELQRSERLGRKDGRFALREKKIHEEFEAEVEPVRKAMRVFDVETISEIPAKLRRGEVLKAQVMQLRAQLQAMEAQPDYVAAARELPVLRKRIDALNAQLEQRGSYLREAREVERELAWVRESIALAQGGLAPEWGGAASAGALEDPTPPLVALAAELLALDPGTLQGLLRDRCVQYLGALTDRRYVGLEFEKDGRAVALAAGRRIPVGELPPKDLDLYFLALRLTVAERTSTRVKLPFLVEEALAGVEEAKLPLVARMLKHLGTLTQVLHVSAQPAFGQMSDGVVNL